MGSSKTGSLDKFASFSPAAALASGKVKLPATGLVGMLQQRQEDKVTRNAARMAGQPQQSQYDQMMMQMMGQQKRPEFMSPYSPAPYANGGNVALRRKMFKLGGSASAHGTGLTSGLEFNQGGRVGLKSGGSTVDDLFEKGAKAGEKLSKTPIKGRRGLVQRGLGFLLSSIFGKAGPAIGRATARRSTTPIQAFLRQNPRSGKALLGLAGVGGGLGGASIASNLLPDFDRFGDPDDPNKFLSGPLAQLTRSVREGVVDPFVSISPLGGLGYGVTGETAGSFLRDLAGKEARKSTEEEMGQDDSIRPGMSVSELTELANQRQREDLQAAMEMYQELIRGEDNTNKLMTLGDAAIAAGAALMEGEGYGGAATAFNEPLAQARMTQAERDQAAQSAAAQLAIGEDMSRRQADEALFNTLAAEGQLDTAEEIDAIVLARKFGIVSRLPEDDKGEVAEGITSQAGVYVDPKKRFGGKLFVSINSSGDDIATNDPEEAKQHAKS